MRTLQQPTFTRPAALPNTRRLRIAIVAIKVVHTAIFAVVSTSILHVFWAGVRNRPSRWTGRAIVIVLAEMSVFVVNEGRCPLTVLAEELGAESGRVSDIFLPQWFAQRIPLFYTPPFLVGVLALLWHRKHRRAGRRLQSRAEACTSRPPPHCTAAQGS